MGQTRMNSYLSANWFSKLFLCWVVPSVRLGASRDLNEEDVEAVLPGDTTRSLGIALEAAWNVAILNAGSSKNKGVQQEPKFENALMSVFFPRLLPYQILALLHACVLQVSLGVLLGGVIRFLQEPAEDWTKFYFTIGLVGTQVISSLAFQHHSFGFDRVCMQMASATSALVYRKTLKLSQKSLQKRSQGQILNYLSNDVNSFNVGAKYYSYVIAAPIQFLIVVAVTYYYIGPACLTGILLLLLYIPLQAFMGTVFGRIKERTAAKADQRIRLMHEIVGAIRVIKMYVLELSFAQIIRDLRRKEMRWIGWTQKLMSLNLALSFVASKLTILLTLLVYLWKGNHLTAEQVYVTIYLYELIRVKFTLIWPRAVTDIAQTRISCKRIQEFLLSEEREIGKFPANAKGSGLRIENVSGSWDAVGQVTLSNISLSVGPGQLVAIAGPVGSGKSSVLQAVLEELPLSGGHVEVGGSLSYASQDAWVFNATLRDNVTFGREFEEDWYREVIRACALEPDIRILPQGDMTRVGERGAALSGGQKARINLARAVYAKGDVYLLDDPLSAVDVDVGRFIFNNCIRGLLRDKAVLLVTHQIQFLEPATAILLMEGGRQEAIGTWNEVINRPDLSQLVSEESAEEGRAQSPWQEESPRLVLTPGDFRETTTKVYGTFQEGGGEVEAEKELRSTGGVGGVVYWKFLRSGNSTCAFLFLAVLAILTQGLYTAADFWLSVWTRGEQMGGPLNVSTPSTASLFEIVDLSPGLVVPIYEALVGAVFLAALLRALTFYGMCNQSSLGLHRRLLTGILRAPVRFFDLNPVGRILNRFSKDLGIVDNVLPLALFDTCDTFLQGLGVVVLVGLAVPYLLIPSLVLAVIISLCRNYFLRLAFSARRIETNAKSAVYAHVNVSITGLTTIRANSAEIKSEVEFERVQDMHTASWFLCLGANRWLGVVIELLTSIYIGVVAVILALLYTDGTVFGVCVSSLLSLITVLQWAVRMSTEVANHMVSAERLFEFAEIQSEAPLESSPGMKPSIAWPTAGAISFKNVCLQYGTGSAVLRDISFEIKGQEKVGVVGRTGAGKSSLLTALFRLVELSRGSIEIDGQDVGQIGLADLRSRISIIPQDPVLFAGSIRRNLDPLAQHTDNDIWLSLTAVEMADGLKEGGAGLDSEVCEGGSNLSVGERQLLCLARALLNKNRILVLDEATANVDQGTDALIQNTLRTKFAQCTVITIAHRLHTVMDADRVLVMDKGRVLEMDKPSELLRNPLSHLRGLVQRTGDSSLLELAMSTDLERPRLSCEQQRELEIL